jgi:CO/xanthine dehydrogenase Mo-binding subunit
MFLARLLGIGEHQVRVLMRDTGGGFGQKVARCARTCASHWRRCSFRSR